MAGQIRFTGTLRDMTRQLYAETVATIEELFVENQPGPSMQLSNIRICCGSEKMNRRDGSYCLPDNTPWLAELTFGAEPSSVKTDSRTEFGALPSGCIGDWPCIALQGVGNEWGGRLERVGFRKVSELAALDHQGVLKLKKRLSSNRVFEFHRKALTALVPCPVLPITSLDLLCPFDILSLSETEALAAAPDLSVSQWQELTGFLGSLVAVACDSYLSRWTLARLLDR